MIKNILFVGLLLAGGTHWALAQSQTTVGAAASLPASKKENMTISQLFQKVEDNSKSLRTSLSGIEAAHLGIESAKSKKLPDLDASLSFSYIGNALITDRDFSNVHGLKSPHFGNNFAFPGTAGGLRRWSHQRRHQARRTRKAAGRGRRETHPTADSLHRPRSIS